MAKSIQMVIPAIIFSLLITPAHAVNRDELINKCIEAGVLIQKQGLKTAIEQIEDINGPFV